MNKSPDDLNIGERQVRENDGRVHVQTSHWVDSNNPQGDMLLRVEVWPIPPEFVMALSREIAELAKKRLEEADLASGGEDWNFEQEGIPPGGSGMVQ